MRQASKIKVSGSHTPLVASSSVLRLEARSMGSSRMMLTGRNKARKMGTKT